MSEKLLGAILSELRQMHATLRRQFAADQCADLLAEIRAEFGTGNPFTTSALIEIADDQSYGALAQAIVQLVNLDSPSAAEKLGRILAAMPDISVEHKRGVCVFRVRGDGD